MTTPCRPASATAAAMAGVGALKATETLTTSACNWIARSMPAATPAAVPDLSSAVFVCLIGMIVTSGATPVKAWFGVGCAAISPAMAVPWP